MLKSGKSSKELLSCTSTGHRDCVFKQQQRKQKPQRRSAALPLAIFGQGQENSICPRVIKENN
jgi:hypothetical protein